MLRFVGSHADKTAGADRHIIIGIEKTMIVIGITVTAFQYTQLKASAGPDDPGDPGRVQRPIRLETPGHQRIPKAPALCQIVTDRIGLIAVCHDEAMLKHAHGMINDEAGILQLCRIAGFCPYTVLRISKDAVAAVHAEAHDEIVDPHVFFVFPADHNSPAGISIALQIL